MSEVEKLRALLAEARIHVAGLAADEAPPRPAPNLREAIDAALAEPVEATAGLSLKEIEARASLATCGPWKQEYGWNNGGMATAYFYVPASNGGARVEMLADDAAFIVAAREDIPNLVAEARRLTKERDEARAEVERLRFELRKLEAYSAGPTWLTHQESIAAAYQRGAEAMREAATRFVRETGWDMNPQVACSIGVLPIPEHK